MIKDIYNFILFLNGVEFRDIAFDNSVLMFPMYFMILCTIIILFIFYVLLNKPTTRIGKYIISVLVLFSINFFFSFLYVKYAMESMEYMDFLISEYLNLATIISFYSIIIFFILSILLKRFFHNLRNIPFKGPF